MERVVIVGAGQAGLEVAATLRNGGWEGAIAMLGAEPLPPYQRPPLSKKYLLGEMDMERLLLRPESWFQDMEISLHLGVAVSRIDRGAKRLHMADGAEMPYGKLALTLGASPRWLPAAIGGRLEGVHVLRSKADMDAIAPLCVPGHRVLIVGGGYIGLEAAAVMAKLGLAVTLVEAAPRILQRVACKETSDWFRALHRAAGVDIREGVGLERLTGEGHVSGAVLADGTALQADFVLVGIGVAPETALAEAAGLTIDNGIAVDASARTSDPDIVAAGDCASFLRHGARIRLESVQNAIDQAKIAGLSLLGQEAEYDPVPWFWSDQYDTALQIAGLNTGYDTIITRPGPREGAVSHWYYRSEEFLAVDAMNDSLSYMLGKRWLERGQNPPQSLVADAAADLKKAKF